MEKKTYFFYHAQHCQSNQRKIPRPKVEGLFLLTDKQMIELSELGDFCLQCFTALSYHEKFDAHYCPSCNDWRDAACEDPNCKYCDQRPPKPL